MPVVGQDADQNVVRIVPTPMPVAIDMNHKENRRMLASIADQRGWDRGAT